MQGSKEFVQCLCVGNNHWITVATVGCGSDVVNVYDSMNMKLSSTLKLVIADLLHTSSKFIAINYVNMQYQVGGSDCGLFAIASACAVCCGQDPADYRFKHFRMEC